MYRAFFLGCCFLFCTSGISQEDPKVAAQKLIVQKDLDGDGTLCFMECPVELSYDFKLIDTDADKFLTEAEITAYLKSKQTPKKEK